MTHESSNSFINIFDILLVEQLLLTKLQHKESFDVFLSFKTIHNIICFQGFFLGLPKWVQKQKSCWYLSKTNAFWKFKWFLRSVNIYLENLKEKRQNKNKNKDKKNPMRWLKSWVLFEWINHFAYGHERKTYRSSMHEFEMRKGHLW